MSACGPIVVEGWRRYRATMRWSCRSVLGLLVLGCSSSGESSGGPQTTVPSYVGGSSNPPADGSGPAPAATPAATNGSATSTNGTTPSGDVEDDATSEPPGTSSETPGDVPLDGMNPAGGAGEPTGTPGDGHSAEPPVTEPPTEEPPVAEPPELENVLLFTRTTGYRHDSIEPGVAAIQRLGQESGFAVERTELPADFNDERLARYDVVVWLNTDSEVLNEPARRAFERYIRAGGGWVGVHAAAASEYDWAWYGQLLGGAAYFLGHPAVQPARVQVELANHASTAHLPQSFTLTDEWYSFRTNPRSSVQVLMTLAENSYGVGNLAMGDHPIAWYHEFDGGRAWYTALGHPAGLYADPVFTQHLLGGIRWAAGVAP